MLIQGLEIPDVAFQMAYALLAQLLGAEGKLIQRVDKKYTTIFVSKGNGKGQRRLDIPNADLNKLQRRLLRGCLYHIEPWNMADWVSLTGFRRGKSTLDNVEPHLRSQAFFQLDFADAFPTVTSDILREALEGMFETVSVKRMFRFRKVQWFRKSFLHHRKVAPSLFEEAGPMDVLWALREIIISLTTFEDRLPQGAPTSPHLFNMVVEMQGIPTIIKECLKPFGRFVVTIYADNITISTGAEEIEEKARESVISAINRTPFKVKPEKTHYWLARKGLRPITGLSIGSRADERFVTAPQAVQRRARGLLHSALLNPELRAPALGMVSYLLDVYGGKLPQQIGQPYQKLLAAIER